MDPRYSLTGFLVGMLVGMTGMGGGSLMTPLLILLLHVKPTVAVGSDLAYSAIMRSFGGWLHNKAGYTDVGLALRMALGSVPASLIGVWCVHNMEARYGDAIQLITSRMLGLVLVLVSSVLLARSLGLIGWWRPRGIAEHRRDGYAWPIALGAIIGFIVGLTSVGSGTLFGVAMLVIFGMSPRQMIGTDIYHGALLSFAAAAGHVWAHHVDYPLVGNLLVGAVPGVLLGSRISTRMPEKLVRPTIAVVMLISGLKMI
ncbi:MAG TPA: sulfite exporter TauE/SafE family protein [Chthonomonadaceae bacterium]|nr:sulfite exporter TauE/SafE family protein [Chthonomonadaceae bacterium]